MSDLSLKYEALLDSFEGYGSALVAFSGGADSALLSHAALQALGTDRMLAVTVYTPAIPAHERRSAEGFTQRFTMPHVILNADPLEVINSSGNQADRCYHCKTAIFSRLSALARERGLAVVAEGSNTDDLSDFRPGMRAIRELGVVSPLLAAGFSKPEVRALSRELGLPTWDRPAYACLISRFPFGALITTEELARVERAEDALHARGFMQCRVRHFGTRAVVEVDQDRLGDALAQARAIDVELCSLGFSQVEVDARGYRKGRMNG